MHKEAAASYIEATKVGGFETFHLQDAVAGMINDLYTSKDYSALVKKIDFGGTIGIQSPMTMVYSPDLGLATPTSPLTRPRRSLPSTAAAGRS